MIIYNKYSVVSFKNVMFATFIKLQSRTIILNVRSKLLYLKIVNIYSIYINDIFKIKTSWQSLPGYLHTF